MVKMTLGSSSSQGASASSISQQRVSAYEDLIGSLQNFGGETELKGGAYDSAKNYATSIMVPLIQGALLLSEGVGQAVPRLPQKYQAEVGGEDLDSAVLESEIAAYNNSLRSQHNLLRMLSSADEISPSAINRVSQEITATTTLRNDAMEKLQKLNAFANSSNSVFEGVVSDVEGAVQAGLAEISSTFSSFNGTFSVPPTPSWAKTIGVEWRKKEEIDKNYQKVLDKLKHDKKLTDKDVKALQAYAERYPNRELPKNVKEVLDKAEVERKSALSQKEFEKELSKMNRTELEEKYGSVIRSYNSSLQTGYGYSVKDAAELKRNQAILARYQEVKDQPLTPKLKHLSPSKRAKMDKLSQEELEKHYPFLKNLTGRADWDIVGNITRTPAQREERSYAIHRYFEFENAKPISRFDPQYMEKRAAYINETGKNPSTGLEASEAEKFTAKHYGWVKAIPDTVAWTDMMVGSYVGHQVYHGKPIYGIDTDFTGKVKIPKDGLEFTGAGVLKPTDIELSKLDDINVSNIQSKYPDLQTYEYNSYTNPGPLSELSTTPNRNFYGGRYNSHVLTEDTVFYRAGNSENPLGQWFTREAPQSRAQVRIDTAVKDIWLKRDGSYSGQSAIDKVYKIKFPKGTIIYDGPVGSQGGIYQGGLTKEQIFIDSPWNIDGIEVLDSWSIIH